MSLFLEIIGGEQQGERVQIQDGFVIGRKEGDLTLRDPKVSSRHARIERRGDTWLLVDLDSANAIKFEGEKIRELPLENGITFILGRTLCRVVEERETKEVFQELPALQAAHQDPHESHPQFEIEEQTPAVNLETPPMRADDSGLVSFDSWEDPDSPPKEEAPPTPEAPPSWRQQLLEVAKKGAELRPEPKPITLFDPRVRLKIQSGLQAGTEWTLGYGPRSIGAQSIDLMIEEDNVPDVCFELVPDLKGVRFQTEHASSVHLNGRMVESDFLRDGDVIQIRDTRIQVFFDRDDTNA